MARTFYTERDIEDLAKQGIREIEENDNVYITDVARERMEALGIKTRKSTKASASQLSAPSAAPTVVPTGLSATEKQQVIDKVKAGVIARLGLGVDTAKVDTIVCRVVGQL